MKWFKYINIGIWILLLVVIGCVHNVSKETGLIQDRTLDSGQKVTLIGYQELGPWLETHKKVHIDTMCDTVVHNATAGYVIVYTETK